jgi:thioredoxin reductase
MTQPADEPADVAVMTQPADEHAAVAIIGGGPAGLTAAAELAPHVDGEVRVIEREADAGGIPRHSDHPGYGLRDLRRFISGPAYARRLTAMASDAGAVLQTSAMVTGWAGDRTLEITSPDGRRRLRADAVVLATGARERPRPARLIPGDRPEGVYTTGQLQNLVRLYHAEIGHRAVVIGAELVSWSAVLTLREAGCGTVLMTSQYRAAECYAPVRAAGRLALGVPVATRTRVTRINGKSRVESVEIQNLDTGTRRTVRCDTVITTGDWIPDNELARSAGLDIDPATRGPRVDSALRTSTPGVFAAGNLLHPVDTADVAALDGRHVAAQVRQWLRRPAPGPGVRPAPGPGLRPAPGPGVTLIADPPLRWITPQILRPGDPAPARHRLLAWSDAYVPAPHIQAVCDGRIIASRHLPWPAAPGRVFRIPSSLLTKARALPREGAIRIILANAPPAQRQPVSSWP